MAENHFFQLIANIPYLAILTAEEQTDVLASSTQHSFHINEMIFMEGNPATGLWLIESGQVKIAKLHPAGDEYILHLLNAGMSFNDIAALQNGLNPATATALTETVCWVVPVAIIQKILKSNSDSAQAAIHMLTQRVGTLVQQLENLALYSVHSRLARFLLQQAETPILQGVVAKCAAIATRVTPLAALYAASKMQGLYNLIGMLLKLLTPPFSAPLHLLSLLDLNQVLPRYL